MGSFVAWLSEAMSGLGFVVSGYLSPALVHSELGEGRPWSSLGAGFAVSGLDVQSGPPMPMPA